MRKHLWPIGVMVALALAVLIIQPVGAQTDTPEPTEETGTLEPTEDASTPEPTEDTTTPDPAVLKRGEYLTTIMGCSECHTPLDPNTFQPVEDMRWAGGQVFPLDPAGALVVVSKNLTSDKETGIGDWTDEEVKTAITTGISRDGLHLFPVMPYPYFNNIADEDLDTIVAYLRTLPPIKNSVERKQAVPPEQLPKLTRQTGIVAPDPKDTAERGKYLMTALLACGDCHTPVDQKTGQPDMTKYLAGGQPFEGPWGLVYGGNMTPDEKTGIGSWTEDDIRKLMQAGVRPDGRVTVVMPRIYANMTEEDMDALIYYLRNDVKPVENEVPAAALNPDFGKPPGATEAATEAISATEAPAAAAGPAGPSPTLLIVAGIAVVVVIGGLIFFARRGR